MHRDIVFISAVLFTLALLAMTPDCVSAALVFRRKPESLDFLNLGTLGIVSVAMIIIGLVVTWTGYLKKERWTWFVLLTMTCGWAFPDRMLPFILFLNPKFTAGQLISDALREPGPPRVLMTSICILSLMLIALLLPIRSLFRGRETG
jgi:hypothetical protein